MLTAEWLIFGKIVEIGLSQIPTTSRLFESITRVVSWYKNGMKSEKVFENIHNEWDEQVNFAWCHTISNAMIVVAALLYGKDFGTSICLAVQTGFDTDCNGATVGSVYGMAKGFDFIPDEWIMPIHGKLRTDIAGRNLIEVDELAEKTVVHAGY